jgi:hypothetical protein
MDGSRKHPDEGGPMYMGEMRIVFDCDDLDGEVVEYERVPCRRCADSR